MLLSGPEEQGHSKTSQFWSIDVVTLACASGFGVAGMWGLRLAISWLLWQQTSSASWLGALGLCDLIPVLTIGFVSGDFVDRLAIRSVLIGAQCLAALTSGLLAMLLLLDCTTPIVLLSVTVVSAAFSIFVLTARVSALGALVNRSEVSHATGLVNLAGHAGLAIGPPLVGWWLSADSAVAAVATSTGLLAISAFGYHLLNLPAQPVSSARQSQVQTLREGFSFVFAHQHLLVVFGVFLISVLAGRGFHDTLAGFIAETMNGSAAWLGVMIAAGGAGSLVVALRLILMPPPDYFRQLFAGLGVLAAAFLLIGEIKGESAILAGAALLGCGLSMSSAAAQCIALNEAPQALRGRVMGIYTTIWRGGPPLGIMTVSLLAEQFGFRAIPAILAIAIAGLVPLICLTRFRLDNNDR